MADLSHADLVRLAERWLRRQGCGVVLTELVSQASSETPDAIGFRSTVSMLVECKVSRADFLADARKLFRREPSFGMGDWRFYLTPPGLVRVDELPTGWGLLETSGQLVRRVHGGWRGNQPHPAPFEAHRKAERGLLYSALRRLDLRGRLPEIYESPFPAREAIR